MCLHSLQKWAAWKAAMVVLVGCLTAVPVFADVEWSAGFAETEFSSLVRAEGDQVSVAGCPLRADVVGAPDLPVQLCRLVVPRDFEVAEVVLNRVVFTPISGSFQVSPVSPPVPTDGSVPPKPAKPDPLIYNSANPYPASPVELVEDKFLFGYRVVTLRVYPLRYFPASKSLQIATQLDFALRGKQVASRGFEAVRRSVQGDDLVRRTLTRLVKNHNQLRNFAPATRREDAQAAYPDRGQRLTTPWPSLEGLPVDYIIITSGELVESFQPLADWKQAKGWNTVIRTVSDIAAHYPGVDTQERIRNFIIEAGELWGAPFVLLGGDVNVVPDRKGFWDGHTDTYGPTDLYYATTEGNWNANGNAIFGEWSDDVDEGIDFHVGRAPVENIAEADIFVQKVLAYEQAPPADFVETALLMGASLSDSSPYWGQNCKNAINDNYLPDTYNVHRLFNLLGDGDELLTNVTALAHLGLGYHYINHADHSNPRSMGTGTKHGGGDIFPAEVLELQNGARQGVLFSLGCSPNAFDYDSISEAFINHPTGGAVAFMGNTRTGYGCQDDQDEAFFREVFINGITHIGEAFSIARLEMTYFYYRRAMNLLGDPEMVLWTAEPGTLSVQHPTYVLSGLQSVIVSVTDGDTGLPLSGAKVCLYKNDELFAVRTTGSGGSVSLVSTCDTAGEVWVTVTAQNYLPYHVAVPVFAAPEGHLYVCSFEIDDDLVGLSNGNADGFADAGETIELPLQITNGGGEVIYDVVATLSSLTSGVQVIVDECQVGDLLPGATAAAGSFVIAIDPSVAPETPVTLRVDFRGEVDVEEGGRRPPVPYGWYLGEDTFRFPVHAPQLGISRTVLVDDGSGQSQGNGNGIPEQGETIEVYFELSNTGHGAARDVTGVAASAHPNVVIVDPDCAFGEIASMATGQSADPVVITIPSDIAGDEEFSLGIFDHYAQLTTIQVDFIPPSSPQELTFVSGVDYILLTWEPPTTSDLLGYHIYRSVLESGPFERVNDLLQIGASLYLDEDVSSSPTFHYYVTAVDESGNESVSSVTLYAWLTEPELVGWPMKLGGLANSAATVMDIDNDGDLEIFASAKDGKVYGFYHDGRELFDLDNNPTSISGFAEMDSEAEAWGPPSVADLNNDGVFEVVATSRGGENKIYAWSIADGDGDGAPDPLPGWPVHFAGNDGFGICAPALGDVDGDGYVEVVFTAEHLGTVHVLDFNGQEKPGWPQSVLGQWSYATPALADLDLDGDMEIIVGGHNGELYVWEHDGSLWSGWPFVSGRSGAGSAAVGDLDGDGYYEILQNFGDRLYALELDGSEVAGWEGGRFYPRQQYVLASPALGDVDGDGLPEVFLTTNRGVAAWTPAGEELPGWPLDLGCDGQTASSPVVADIDADGEMEILIGYGNHRVYAFEADGSTVLHWPAMVGYTVYATPTVEDVDGDGDMEVIVGAGEQLYIWDCTNSYSTKLIEWGTFHHNAAHTGCYNNLPPLAGIISWPDASPVEGAKVTVRKYGSVERYTTYTDSWGQFVLRPTPGRYRLDSSIQEDDVWYRAVRCYVTVSGLRPIRVNLQLSTDPLPSCKKPLNFEMAIMQPDGGGDWLRK